MTLDQYVAGLLRADDTQALAAFLSLFDGPVQLEAIDGDGPDYVRMEAATTTDLLDLVTAEDTLWFIRGSIASVTTDGGSIWRKGDFLGFQLEVDCQEIEDYDAPTEAEKRGLQEAERRLAGLLDLVVARINPPVACTCAFVALVGDGPNEFAQHVSEAPGWNLDFLPPYRWFAGGHWYTSADAKGIEAIRRLVS